MELDLGQFDGDLVEVIDINGKKIIGEAEFVWAEDSAEGFEEMVDRLIIDDTKTGETVGYLTAAEIKSIKTIKHLH